MATFLYDLHGNWIAWKREPDDKFLWDRHGNWIGWFPWGDNDAVGRDGRYLGTVIENRLLRRVGQPYRGYPGYPGYPGFAGYPGYPGFAGYFGYVPGFQEIAEAQLAR